MTDSDFNESFDAGDKLEWTAPVIRASIPARETQGGPFGGGNQDDGFYSGS